MKSQFKFPGCSNKKKNEIITLLKNNYDTYKSQDDIIVQKQETTQQDPVQQSTTPPPVDSSSKRFVIKKKGQEIIIITTNKHAKQLQDAIDSEESLENQILELRNEREELLSTIEKLSMENKTLKEQIDCTKNYNCNEQQKCNIQSGQCIDDLNDDDDELDEYITSEGHKYIGSKSQIEKIKKQLQEQNAIVSASQQNLSLPDELKDSDEEDIEELSDAIDSIQLRREEDINSKINSILRISN